MNLTVSPLNQTFTSGAKIVKVRKPNKEALNMLTEYEVILSNKTTDACRQLQELNTKISNKLNALKYIQDPIAAEKLQKEIAKLKEQSTRLGREIDNTFSYISRIRSEFKKQDF